MLPRYDEIRRTKVWSSVWYESKEFEDMKRLIPSVGTAVWSYAGWNALKGGTLHWWSFLMTIIKATMWEWSCCGGGKGQNKADAWSRWSTMDRQQQLYGQQTYWLRIKCLPTVDSRGPNKIAHIILRSLYVETEETTCAQKNPHESQG